ncbi:hypothetical protein APED_06505 [Acanthopleuribacter pedis]
MTTDFWEHAERIFLQASEMEPGERTAFLATLE